MKRDDRAYLLDMLIAADKATSPMEGLTLPEFETSELHQDAECVLWKSLEKQQIEYRI